jgi:hypothetical protein
MQGQVFCVYAYKIRTEGGFYLSIYPLSIYLGFSFRWGEGVGAKEHRNDSSVWNVVVIRI